MKRDARLFDSIFSHSLLLAFGSALAVALASVAIVFASRGPFYFPLSTFEVARLMEGKSSGRADPRLERAIRSAPPAERDDVHDDYERLLADALAANLGRERADVVFEIVPTPRGFDAAVDIARHEYVGLVRQGAEYYAGDPRFAPLIFGSFRAGVRRADGRWVVVSRIGADPGPQWQLVLARWIFVAFVLLLPIAWIFSSRLAQPIRTFAAAADRIGHGSFERVEVRGAAEIRTAAAALNEMQERLERHVRERTAVVGAIAHDLRTPLARLAFLLRDAPAPLKAKTEAEVAGMERLISVALDYVHSETAAPRRDSVDLRLVVESVVDDFADMGEDARFAPGPSALVAGDSVLLTRLVRNLVANALFYGARARVSLSIEGAAATVAIEDDGPGIPEKDLERVFEPFYRGEQSRNERTGGIGLGLAIVRSLARAHGGAVSLSNRPEGGLVARVTLPISK